MPEVQIERIITWVFLFQPCPPPDNMVRELARVRVDHHPHHHRQLRRHGTRLKTAKRRQNSSVTTTGKTRF